VDIMYDNDEYEANDQMKSTFPNKKSRTEHYDKAIEKENKQHVDDLQSNGIKPDHQNSSPQLLPLVCQTPGCSKRFKKPCDLRRHQRIHLDCKPFRCKWPGCSYAGKDYCTTIRHIRMTHFRRSSKSGDELRQQQWDPKVYL